jgi:hypothetical protein
MASIRIDGDTVHIELSGWDQLWAVHGSFAIPLENVAGATTEKPPSFWETLKIMGTGSIWPLPVKMAGTFLYHGEVVFFDYQGDESVLVIDLKPGTSSYKHIFVHVDPPDTPEAAAQRINDALPKGP